jgi:hypothetical protein
VDLALAPGCAIQRSVSHVLDDFLNDAEALLQKRLERMSVADLAARVRGGRESRKQKAESRNGARTTSSPRKRGSV